MYPSLNGLGEFVFVSIFILLPLATWKVIDLIILAFQHVHIRIV